MPVRPAQHYTMGGVRTDHTGESPTLEGTVRGRRSGVLGHAWLQSAGRQLGGRDRRRGHDRRRVHRRFLRPVRERRRIFPTGVVAGISAARAGQARRLDRRPRHGERRLRCMAEMQEIMTAKVGIFRSGEVLEEAVDELQTAARAQPQHRPALQGARRQSGAGHRLPRAEDAQAGAVRRLRRARSAPKAAARTSARTSRAATTPSG